MGHDVTLYEKSGELGGTLIAAAKPCFKGRIRNYTAWQIRQLEKQNVKIVFHKALTADSEELADADRIIIDYPLCQKAALKDIIIDSVDIKSIGNRGRRCSPSIIL